MAKLDYPEIAADLAGVVADLAAAGLVWTEAALGDCAEVLALLQATELHALRRTLKIPVPASTGCGAPARSAAALHEEMEAEDHPSADATDGVEPSTWPGRRPQPRPLQTHHLDACAGARVGLSPKMANIAAILQYARGQVSLELIWAHIPLLSDLVPYTQSGNSV